jgi:hypothetical protein
MWIEPGFGSLFYHIQKKGRWVWTRNSQKCEGGKWKSRSLPGAASNPFCGIEFRFSSGLRLVGPVAHVKELLHFTAFISTFVGFIRTIRHLSKRVLGVADHLEH